MKRCAIAARVDREGRAENHGRKKKRWNERWSGGGGVRQCDGGRACGGGRGVENLLDHTGDTEGRGCG
jgi:hypothetical protein